MAAQLCPISLVKIFLNESHEYCFFYAKNINKFQMNLLPRTEKQNKDYTNPDNDPGKLHEKVE